MLQCGIKITIYSVHVFYHVAELKGRTSSQLPVGNQSISAVRRDNEQHIIYAGRTVGVNLSSFDYEGSQMLEDAHTNLATVPGCIKTGGESVGQAERLNVIAWSASD